MIEIKLKPSFHKFSSIILNENHVEYEICPRLKNLNDLDKKEKLTVAEYLKLKEINAFNKKAEKERYLEKSKILDDNIPQKLEIEKLITQIFEKPQIDERILLDGIVVECSIKESGTKPKVIKFYSPDTETREYEIIKNLFSILNDCFKKGPILNHIELIQGYFGIGEQWKITNKDPLTIRLFGRLSTYEKEPLKELFRSLKSNDLLILDVRNLEGMGGTLHECFEKLMDRMKVVYWLIEDSENELLKHHFDEMKISSTYILTSEQEIIKKIGDQNTN